MQEKHQKSIKTLALEVIQCIANQTARMALGALIINEKCGFSGIETVEQIAENPYLQFFIGLKEYKTEAPFDPSLIVHCSSW